MQYMSIDWTKLFQKYKGRWIALKEDEKTVVSVGNSAKEALLSAQKEGYANPILTKMPKSLVSYVGFGL